MAFGSGFTCNSAAWHVMQAVPAKKNPGLWANCIDELPMDMMYKKHKMEPRHAAPASVTPVFARA